MKSLPSARFSPYLKSGDNQRGSEHLRLRRDSSTRDAEESLVLVTSIWVRACIPPCAHGLFPPETLAPGEVATAVTIPVSALSPSAATRVHTSLELTQEPSTHAAPPTLPVPLYLSLGEALEIRRVDMVSSTDGWALGGLADGADHVLRSQDGGLHWLDVSPPDRALQSEDPWSARGLMTGLGEDRWVVFGQSPPSETSPDIVVWHSRDAGQSWTPSQPLGVEGLLEFFTPAYMGFTDAKAGWLLVSVGAGMSHEYVVLYTTADGGKAWEKVMDPYGDQPVMAFYKTGLTFADAQHGWMTRDGAGVMDGVRVDVTADGGRTWVSHELEAPPGAEAFTYPLACYPHSPMMASAMSGIVGVSCRQYAQGEVSEGPHYIYRTEDGWKTWTARRIPAGPWLS